MNRPAILTSFLWRGFALAAGGVLALSLLFSSSVLIKALIPTTTAIQPDHSAEPQAGANLWVERGCVGCHSLFGSGGLYGGDLTASYAHMGADNLKTFLFDPGAARPDSQRPMPRVNLTNAELDTLIEYLRWTSDTSGAVIAIEPTVASVVAAETADDPVARGSTWFHQAPANCVSCHSLEPGVVIVGPSLAGIATRAGERVAGLSAAEYLRQSMIEPSAHVVEGFEDVMAKNLAEVLSGEQITDLVAFLLTLE